MVLKDTSGAGYKRLISIGEALADSPRWSPWVRGLKGTARSTTAIILENQARHIAKNPGRIQEVTKILNIGNFDKFAMPMIRAVYPNLIANEIVSVQPMAGPTSLVFYMDINYGTTKGGITAGTAAFDARTGSTGNETYSSDGVSTELLSGSGASPVTYSAIVYRPIRPGTVTLIYTHSVDGVTTLTDDGNGGMIGGGASFTSATIDYTTGVIVITNSTGTITAATTTVAYRYDSEISDLIPQIDLQLTSAGISAVERKLRIRYSLEAAQDLQHLQGIDAESEVVAAASEVMKHELDREIINNLVQFAGAGTVTWDRTTPAGVSYTEHKLSLVDAFVSASNKVFSATKRGQTNWIVASVSLCDVIETLPTFVPAPGALGVQSNSGVLKIGTLNNRWTVYKDPFLATNTWLQGWKGNNFLDTGYIYAPYIPLYTTPTVVLDDFLGRRGIATRYGSKLVNGLFYVKGTMLAA